MASTAVATRGFGGPGDIIAIAAGMPFGVAGSTNLLRIEQMPTEPGAARVAGETVLEAEGA